MPILPGGLLARRPLHFIWIVDCSSLMGYGGKIQSLNYAIRNMLPALHDAAAGNPNAEIMMRAVKFSSGASWHLADPVPIEQFHWDDLEAGGVTDMGEALRLVAEQLDPARMPQRMLPPVLVLVSCSKPTDDVSTGLRALMDQPWGRKAVRVAIAIGDDADLSVLQRFIGHPELEPLQANNSESLVKFIKWISTAILRTSTEGEKAMPTLPGGPLARRPLHFIWIADCSGSMGYGGKIQSLNYAIRNALPAMQDVAKENPNAEVMVRAVKFSSGASWHVANPVPVDQFKWDDLEATTGVTEMGKALQLVAAQLDQTIIPQRALPPVLVLISDGQPTDDVSAGLRDLMAQPLGEKAVRIAIAIGEDADTSVLQRFIGHPELEPLQANNAQSLVRFIRWVSTSVLKEVSSPEIPGPDPNQEEKRAIPPLPDPTTGPGEDDW